MKKTMIQMKMMEVAGEGGQVYYGGSQEWYHTTRQKRAGCGPTAASNLVWYIARTKPHLAALWDVTRTGQEDFLCLMEEMFQHITPGRGGVNTTEKFTAGALRFGEKQGAPLRANVMEVPTTFAKRPTPDEVESFILAAMEADFPVAFLNLSNGGVKNLDRWHWVTIMALEPHSMNAVICDQGDCLKIDLGRWLKATILGGGFVWLDGKA